MKMTLLFLLTTLMGGNTCYGTITTNGSVFIVGLETGKYYEYSVPAERLPPKVLWRPGEDDFPLTIHEEIFKAERHLIIDKGETNTLSFQRITVRPLKLPAPFSQSLSKTASGDPTHWYLAFSFQAGLWEALERHVVVFMDGTYAIEGQGVSKIENIRKKRLKERVKTRAEFTPASTNRPATQKTFRVVWPVNGDLHTDLPSNVRQWDPMNEPFPIDLKLQIHKVRHVIQENKLLDLSFQGFAVNHYTPRRDCAVRGENLQEHRNHWYVELNWSSGVESKELVSVVLLLDGSIHLITASAAGQQWDTPAARE